MCEIETYLNVFVVHTRGDVSYEFFFASGDMSNLAYIGAKKFEFWPITGFVYFETIINKSCYW